MQASSAQYVVSKAVKPTTLFYVKLTDSFFEDLDAVADASAAELSVRFPGKSSDGGINQSNGVDSGALIVNGVEHGFTLMPFGTGGSLDCVRQTARQDELTGLGSISHRLNVKSRLTDAYTAKTKARTVAAENSRYKQVTKVLDSMPVSTKRVKGGSTVSSISAKGQAGGGSGSAVGSDGPSPVVPLIMLSSRRKLGKTTQSRVAEEHERLEQYKRDSGISISSESVTDDTLSPELAIHNNNSGLDQKNGGDVNVATELEDVLRKPKENNVMRDSSVSPTPDDFFPGLPLRERLIHLLAVHAESKLTLAKLLGCCSNKEQAKELGRVLGEVAQLRKNRYYLIHRCYFDVNPNHELYSPKQIASVLALAKAQLLPQSPELAHILGNTVSAKRKRDVTEDIGGDSIEFSDSNMKAKKVAKRTSAHESTTVAPSVKVSQKSGTLTLARVTDEEIKFTKGPPVTSSMECKAVLNEFEPKFNRHLHLHNQLQENRRRFEELGMELELHKKKSPEYLRIKAIIISLYDERKPIVEAQQRELKLLHLQLQDMKDRVKAFENSKKKIGEIRAEGKSFTKSSSKTSTSSKDSVSSERAKARSEAKAASESRATARTEAKAASKLAKAAAAAKRKIR